MRLRVVYGGWQTANVRLRLLPASSTCRWSGGAIAVGITERGTASRFIVGDERRSAEIAPSGDGVCRRGAHALDRVYQRSASSLRADSASARSSRHILQLQRTVLYGMLPKWHANCTELRESTLCRIQLQLSIAAAIQQFLLRELRCWRLLLVFVRDLHGHRGIRNGHFRRCMQVICLNRIADKFHRISTSH